MVKRYTEKELSEKLKDLTIIVDSREQATHPQKYFERNKIPYVVRKIDTGDYSAMLGDMTMEHEVFIERKSGLTELSGNLGTDRDRFTREFTRAKADRAKPFLLIENDTIEDVFLGNYRSKLQPKSLWGSLCTWMTRYNTTVIFCKSENTGRIIYGILYYFAREELLYGTKG